MIRRPNFSHFLSKQSDNPLYRWWWSIDRTNIVLIAILMVLGIVMVATASSSVAIRIGAPANIFLIKHIVFLMPAIVALFTLSLIPHQYIFKIGSLLFCGAIAGVLMTLMFGIEVKGATRWISMFGFSIQPSEFLKPAFVIMSSWLMAQQKTDPKFPGFLMACGLYVLSIALLISQPDFGMCFVITLVFAMQIFLFGCPLRYVIILAGIGLVGMLVAYTTLGHVQSRVDRFLFPSSGDTYQIDQSKEAFMNGGVMGTGLGQGIVKNQVPDIHADFIFTAIGEEFGFILTLVVILIYAALYYRFFSRFVVSQSLFVILAGSGLTFMLVVQTFIHMGSALHLIPAKGMTLPLISYGGSSLLAVCITFGFMLALSRGIQDDKKRATWRHLVK